MLDERTVIVITEERSVKIRKIFNVATTHISAKDKKDITELAASFGQVAEFFPSAGWSGIEAVKWDIKEMNGAIDPEEEAKKISENAAKGRSTWGGGMD